GAVNGPPHHERPVRAVPQPAQDHGQQKIPISLPLAVPVAAERDVEVIAQPRAEADVPAAPEALQARGEVRLAKIDHEVEAEELRASARDIDVYSEIAGG